MVYPIFKVLKNNSSTGYTVKVNWNITQESKSNLSSKTLLYSTPFYKKSILKIIQGHESKLEVSIENVN